MKPSRRLALFLLACGASLIVGLLSFGGLFALWPILPLAGAAFVLSVAYEGEIYLQNIKGAMNKLFKPDHLKRQIAKDYLLEHLQTILASDTTEADVAGTNHDRASPPQSSLSMSEETPRDQAPTVAAKPIPQFFKDYQTALQQLDTFNHPDAAEGHPHVHLDKASRARKKQIEKTLGDMEKWFSIQLLGNTKKIKKGAVSSEDSTTSAYARELRAWLSSGQHAEAQEAARKKLTKHRRLFNATKVFSFVAGAFMGLGTTYLLSGTFAALPFLAALPIAAGPALIIPMSIIAGTAYSLLIYNSVTDMIKNDTLRQWYTKLRDDWKAANNWRAALRSLLTITLALALTTLAIALTVCTAGTWWTIAKETAPLFAWMSRVPSVVMGALMGVINAISIMLFNVENVAETLDMVHEAIETPKPLSTRIKDGVKKWATDLQHVLERENFWQKINLFRIVLKLTIAPLRIVLFLGHLISIGITSDRLPGVPELISAFLGIINEGFEDAHYFLDHEHPRKAPLEERLGEGHGHHHHNDIPTRLLKIVFSPLYIMAGLWDYGFSKLNQPSQRPKLSITAAMKKQAGIQAEITVDLPTTTAQPSKLWEVEHTIYRIERHKEKELEGAFIHAEISKQKSQALTALQTELCSDSQRLITAGDDLMENHRIRVLLAPEKNKAVYHAHRFFDTGRTKTVDFLEVHLPNRVAACSA